MSPWLIILPASNNLSFAFYLIGLDRIWQDVVKDTSTPTKLDEEQFDFFLTAFLNLPSFLKKACYLHYVQRLSFAAAAEEMKISEQLAKQWVDVSIALLRLLYSSKPKNPE
ncbi:MAG: hypothetical protein JWN76_416 [Chitinophagaceae bacterium]|nr:hypothetical protein [Chitinophagaceae bacterium]